MSMLSKIINLIYKDDSRTFKIRFLLALLVDFTFAFSVFAFIPYEVYLGNTIEFTFTLSEFYAPLLLASGVFIVTLAVHLLMKGKLFNIYTSLIFGFTVAAYIQSMFLNGMMKNLDGSDENWASSDMTVNLVIWAVVILAPAVISIFYQEIWSFICKLGSAIILGAQTVAFVSLLLTSFTPNIETTITTKGIYDLSGKNNVIVFVLDMFDQGYVDAMLEMHPDAMDELKGFTYYPNATCKYTFTHLGIPYLLTGNEIPEYNPTNEQYIEQIENSMFFNSVAKNADNVGIYTQEFCIRSNAARAKMDNCIKTEYSISNKTLVTASLKASLYRVAPFRFKAGFTYEASNFNDAIETKTVDGTTAFSCHSHETEANMMVDIQNGSMQISEEQGENSFKFIHLKGTHVAYQLTKDVKFTEEPTSVQDTAAGSLALVAEYCKALDKLGLFDDATIIVTADHGLTWVWENFSGGAERAVTPLFLYKPAGVTRAENLKTDLSPASQDDIFPTVVKALGGDSTEFGQTIEEATKNLDRKRYYYAAFQDPEITNERSCLHVQYEITGDSRSLDNWKQTGVIIYPHDNPRHKDAQK